MINQQNLLTRLEDENLVQKYLHRFSTDMPILMQKMQTSLINHEWAALAIEAHTYKSQVQYLDDDVSGDLAFEVEKTCADETPDPDRLQHLLYQLEMQLGLTLDEIRKITG